MKLYNILDEILDSKSKLRILRLVFKHPEREFTEFEISKMISMSPNTVNLALSNLRKTNIFLYKRIGRTHSYKCNSESVLFDLIKKLYDQERQLRTSLFDLFEKKLSSIGTCVVFGSFASEKEDFDSDLDLLVITKRINLAEQKIEDLSQEVLKRFSIVISPVILTHDELRSKSGKSFIRNAFNNGILVAGKKLRLDSQVI